MTAPMTRTRRPGNQAAFTRARQVYEDQARVRGYGGHWFSPSTMAFFDSRVETGLIGGEGSDGGYFITSERAPVDPDGYRPPRAYTIRRFTDLGTRAPDVETVGGFQDYPTLGDALGDLQRHRDGVIDLNQQEDL